MQSFAAIFMREFRAYFLTNIGYVFIAAFTAISILFALQIGQLIETNRADLWSFFQFHPWLYIVFVPILGMRSWAEEIRTHTLDSLLSLPVPIVKLVVAKFFAGLSIIAIALFCTVPFWIAIGLLGSVDSGATLASYLGSLLLAGAMLAITNAISARSQSQIIVFVIAALFCFIASVTGLPIVSQIISGALGTEIGATVSSALASFSFIDQFEKIARGNISMAGVFFFISTIALWLGLAALFVDNKRSVIN